MGTCHPSMPTLGFFILVHWVTSKVAGRESIEFIPIDRVQYHLQSLCIMCFDYSLHTPINIKQKKRQKCFPEKSYCSYLSYLWYYIVTIVYTYRYVLSLPRLWQHRGRLKALTIDQSRCGRSGSECTDGLLTPTWRSLVIYQAINWDMCVNNKMNSTKMCQEVRLWCHNEKRIWQKKQQHTNTAQNEIKCIYLTGPLDFWKRHPASEHSSEETCRMEQDTLIPSTSPACRTWNRMRRMCKSEHHRFTRSKGMPRTSDIKWYRWSLRASRYRKYGAMAPAQIAEFAAAHAAAQHT